MSDWCGERHPEPSYFCRCVLPPGHPGQHGCDSRSCDEHWGTDQMPLFEAVV